MPAQACRGCLATGHKLYNIYKNNLYEVFGEVVGNPIFESDDLPQHICGMCFAQLIKYVSFRNRCRAAQDLLEDFKLQGMKLTTRFIKQIDRAKCNLLLNINIATPPSYDLIIHEIPNEKLEEHPVSDREEKPSQALHVDDFLENIVPYIDRPNHVTTPAVISKPIINDPVTKYEQKTKGHPKRKVYKNKYDNPKVTEEFMKKYNMDVVYLTKEQQVDEVKEKIRINSTRQAGPYCSYCGKSCLSQENLEKHMKQCHDVSAGPAECEICRCRYSNRQLLKHLTTHKIRISCRRCDFSTKTFVVAANHARRHDVNSDAYQCKYCDAVFDNSELLNTHVSTKHPNKLLWCKFCGESVKNQLGLRFHSTKVHADLLKSKHQCQNCCLKFVSSEALDKHSSLSCEDYNCVMCGDHFETKPLLKKHVIQHHSRCEYLMLAQCTGCGVKFFGTEPLAKHREDGFCGSGHPCQECGVTFPSARAMEDHKVEFHVKLYRACEECDKAFDAKNYRQHISRVHNTKPASLQRGVHPHTSTKVWSVHGSIIAGVGPERARPPGGESPKKRTLMCDVCGKTYSKFENLKVHARVHTGERPFSCDICRKGFIRKQSLKTHVLLHTGERPHKCPHCPKTFRRRIGLTRHILCHTGVRRHICRVCGKKFRTSSCIKVHIKSVHLNVPVRGPRKRRFIQQHCIDMDVDTQNYNGNENYGNNDEYTHDGNDEHLEKFVVDEDYVVNNGNTENYVDNDEYTQNYDENTDNDVVNDSYVVNDEQIQNYVVIDEDIQNDVDNNEHTEYIHDEHTENYNNKENTDSYVINDEQIQNFVVIDTENYIDNNKLTQNNVIHDEHTENCVANDGNTESYIANNDSEIQTQECVNNEIHRTGAKGLPVIKLRKQKKISFKDTNSDFLKKYIDSDTPKQNLMNSENQNTVKTLPDIIIGRQRVQIVEESMQNLDTNLMDSVITRMDYDPQEEVTVPRIIKTIHLKRNKKLLDTHTQYKDCHNQIQESNYKKIVFNNQYLSSGKKKYVIINNAARVEKNT